jgi:hypothetical protein
MTKVDVKKLKAVIAKQIESQHGIRYTNTADEYYLHEDSIYEIIDSLAEPDALSQISSKNYGADDIGLTHEEVDSFLAVEREPVETDAIEYIFDNFPIDEDVDKAREQLEALKAELASMTARLEEQTKIIANLKLQLRNVIDFGEDRKQLKEANAIIKELMRGEDEQWVNQTTLLKAREYLAKVGK